MTYLKNPFGLHNGTVVLISDLSVAERGAKCGCVCPNCGGELIARMGEVVTHHFAHTKDACDETAAFMRGMFDIIMQFIQESKEFYAPALAAKCKFPNPNVEVTRETIGHYVQIVPEDDEFYENIIVVADGRFVKIRNAEIAFDFKKRAEAIIVDVGKKRFAIRIQPPQICKASVARPYLDLPTLVFDASDIDFHSMSSKDVKTELLDTAYRWSWLVNKKVELFYDEFFHDYQKWLKKLIKREEEQRKQREILLKKQLEAYKEEEARLLIKKSELHDEWQIARAKYPKDIKSSTGYYQVSKRFTQQDAPILDAYGCRWLQCKICGEIKRDIEFDSYGETGTVNSGECCSCVQK